MVRKYVEDSLIRAGTAVAVLVAVATWCWWAGAKLQHIDDALTHETEMQAEKHKGLDGVVADHEMRLRGLELARPKQ